ncbi:olfactory receptor 52B2-like [Engraulis encrasicolus]|uniref:olfactory receptor 52B2-like n=1 Tax=Engraulis encrasicolus TaxID=184585 RepID=UPI002FCF6F06
MENDSISFEISLDPFFVPGGSRYIIFFVGLAIYLFCIGCNLTLLGLIIAKRALHKPMYFILFSLPFNDLIGITAMLPKVLSDILTDTSSTYYPLCVLQGFLLHMYGGGILFILAAMAFDRYVAICSPLRYNTLMTPKAVAGIIAIVWGLDFIFIFTIFVLQARIPRCKSKMMNVFCDNPSLLKMTCGNTLINNIVGLTNTALMQIISISIQAVSYVKILIACLVMRKNEARSKAINTCVAQLVIFFSFEITSTFTILSHRFQHVSPNLQKIMGMLIFLVPPILNPLVYGLNSQEIRKNLFGRHTKVSV